jgi:hypothetical protein
MNELVSDYSHSHIQGIQTDFGYMCMGNGPILSAIDKLQRNGFTAIDFEIFLYHIKAFAEYESIEGNPFRRIEHIAGNREMHSLTISDQERYGKDLVKKLFQNKSLEEIKTMFRISISRDYINIIPTEELEISLAAIGLAAGYPITLIGTRSANGKYMLVGSSQAHSSDATRFLSTKLDFEFRGEKIKHFKLVNTDPNGDTKQYIHPQLTGEVCSRVRQSFYKNFSQSQKAARESKAEDIRETSERNLIPV